MSTSRVNSGAASRMGTSTPYLAREPTGCDTQSREQTPSELAESEESSRRNVIGYNIICADLGIIPSSYIERVLWACAPEVKMRTHGLGTKGTRALCTIMVSNLHVERMDLSDNNIGNGGARALAQMLDVNSSISTLDVSCNNIEESGLRVLCNAIVDKKELKMLNLSGNRMSYKGIHSIHTYIENNISLSELYLSNCSIDSNDAELLSQAIAANDTLLLLDLSWNKIRGHGAVAIANGLRDNRGLLKVNLSWNGFAAEGAKALEDTLKKNKTLVELDLSSNRLHAEAVVCLFRGMQRNNILECLKLSKNPLTPEAAAALLKGVNQMKHDTFRELHLKDIEVNDEFMDELAELRQKRTLIVHTGALLSRRLKRSTAEQPILDSSELFRSIVEGKGVKAVDEMLQQEFKARTEILHKQIVDAKKRDEARKIHEAKQQKDLEEIAVNSTETIETDHDVKPSENPSEQENQETKGDPEPRKDDVLIIENNPLYQMHG